MTPLPDELHSIAHELARPYCLGHALATRSHEQVVILRDCIARLKRIAGYLETGNDPGLKPSLQRAARRNGLTEHEMAEQLEDDFGGRENETMF